MNSFKDNIEKIFNILVSPINSIYKYEAINNFKHKLSIGKDENISLKYYEFIKGKKETGVIYTPEQISNYMIKNTVSKKDIINKEEMKKYLLDFSNKISTNLYKRNSAGKTITVKIKTSNFKTHTRSKTVNNYTRDKDEIYSIACDILDNINFKEPISLIGLTVSNLGENKIKQLTFKLI